MTNWISTIADLIKKLCELAGKDYNETMAELAARHKIETEEIDKAAEEQDSHLPD